MSTDANHTLTLALILLGPPASGKGTQARYISKFLGIPHISTGNILRDNIERKTPLGRLAESFVDRGILVSDEIATALVRERLMQPDTAAGFLLDGYPRTLPQALALKEMLLNITEIRIIAVSLKVSYDTLVKRLSERATCPTCQRTYSISVQRPARSGFCDDDGTALQHRVDDSEGAVRNRLAEYDNSAAPLIDFYRKEGQLVEIDGQASPGEVTVHLEQVIRFRSTLNAM